MLALTPQRFWPFGACRLIRVNLSWCVTSAARLNFSLHWQRLNAVLVQVSDVDNKKANA
jgi:hypothetical protein